MLSAADHERVHAAIAEAEAATSGEIFCIVARESGAYREVPLAWAAVVSLLGPPLALAFGARPWMLMSPLEGGWTAAHAGAAEGMLTRAVVGYAGLQAVLFALALALTAIPPVRRLLTPGFAKRAHVHARAIEQFAHRRHVGRARTGVLIYASVAERRVEIIADEAIHAKVGDAFWNDAVKAAVAKIRAGDAPGGLIAAIELCGRAMAEHFPRRGGAHAGPTNDLQEI
jgi:putative membrane protein